MNTTDSTSDEKSPMRNSCTQTAGGVGCNTANNNKLNCTPLRSGSNNNNNNNNNNSGNSRNTLQQQQQQHHHSQDILSSRLSLHGSTGSRLELPRSIVGGGGSGDCFSTKSEYPPNFSEWYNVCSQNGSGVNSHLHSSGAHPGQTLAGIGGHHMMSALHHQSAIAQY